jgi:hypothetical protein
MSKTDHIVTGALASVIISGVTVTVPHGAYLPEGVSDELIDHLKAVGLVEVVTVADEEEAGGESADVTIPEGQPSEAWKAAELEAYAKREGIDLGSERRNKAALAAFLLAAKGPDETVPPTVPASTSGGGVL